MLKNCSLFISALFLLALANLYCANSAVIGLDLGSEYMKISSISPGKSFYIVEDTTTKRKTPTSIAFQGSERFYEYDTIVKRPKAFQTTFTNLPRFLGKFFSDPELQQQGKTYLEDYLTVGNERGTVSFKLKNFRFGAEDDAEHHLSVEELMGMIFRHVKDLTQKQNERKMKDIVVTIPSFWTFKERYALSDALLLADLTPLSYIHENTAAALYYSLERQDNETHTAIFYNLGSTSLEVSLVEFQLKNSTEEYLEDEMYENFRVLAEAWDENLGSLHIDLNLLNHFAKEFDALPQRKGQKSVLTSNPAKAKLLKEVSKLKEILSANKQAPFYVENLFESTDFKSSLDRTTFEEINKEFFESLTKPIEEVLARANKTLQDIDAIELIGGGIRVPKIQQVLSEYIGEKELGFHLNGDESMALGSAFHAANFSASFKTRKIFISDGYNFDIKLDVRELESGKSIEINEPVYFPYKTPYGTKKTLELDYDGDLKCAFSAKLPRGESEENVIDFTVTGLKEALEDAKYKTKELSKPKINLYFRLGSLGLIELTKAEGVVEETIQYEEIVKKAKPTATTASTTTTTEETAEANTEDNETAGDAPSAPEVGKTEEEAKEEEPEKVIKTKTVTHRIPLKVESKVPAPEPLTQEQIAKSKELLDKFDKHEEQKKLLAEAKNRLEGFLYSTRDDLEEEMFVEGSTEEERENLNKMLEEHREWLESDEAAKSDHVPFNQRFQDMFKIVNHVKYRIEQRLLRPELVEKAKGDLVALVEKIGEVRKTKEWITEEAEEKVKQEIYAIVSWLSDLTEKQEVLKHNEDPVLTVEDLTKQMNKAIEIFNRYRSTVKPRPPKNDTLGTEGFDFNGKFDEASFKEYMKKMNITFENSTFGNENAGEEVGEGEINLDSGDVEQEEAEKSTEEAPQDQSQHDHPETVPEPEPVEPAVEPEPEKIQDIDL